MLTPEEHKLREALFEELVYVAVLYMYLMEKYLAECHVIVPQMHYYNTYFCGCVILLSLW